MPKISIVTFLSEEVPLIINACEFFPIKKELELEIICPYEDTLKYKSDNLHLTGLNNFATSLFLPLKISVFLPVLHPFYITASKKISIHLSFMYILI